MCSLTWFIGCKDCLPNCSMVGIGFDEKCEPSKLHF